MIGQGLKRLRRVAFDLTRNGAKGDCVEKIIALHVEQLPEGCYLATSDAIQGLVAQGQTIEETLQIARDVAKILLEAQEGLLPQLPEASNLTEYPLIVGV